MDFVALYPTVCLHTFDGIHVSDFPNTYSGFIISVVTWVAYHLSGLWIV